MVFRPLPTLSLEVSDLASLTQNIAGNTVVMFMIGDALTYRLHHTTPPAGNVLQNVAESKTLSTAEITESSQLLLAFTQACASSVHV